MKPSQKCYDLIKHFEGFYPDAYKDPVGIWTIGYGTIKYISGEPVKEGDTITEPQALEELEFEVTQKATSVNLLAPNVTQSQFDAFVSFAYNLGVRALRDSTLLKKFKVNPADTTIYRYTMHEDIPVADSCEFLRWCRAGGHILKGLLLRRAAEADLYAG